MRKNRIATVVSIGLLGLLASSAALRATLPARPAVAAAAAPEVKIDNFSFTPQEITVQAGTKVTWVNQDDTPHTVTSEDGKFKSHALDTDDQFSFTFSEPGTYEYHCSIHPKMTAKVVVK
jgi:plastocyanin